MEDALALGVIRAGGTVSIHTAHSIDEGQLLLAELHQHKQAYLVQADLSDPSQAAELVQRACLHGPLDALVNNAAIFEDLAWNNTELDSWQRTLNINLTAPFLLSQAFARQIPTGRTGRIINILDWRALRPGADHLPYTISKAGLAALTQALAVALAPNIQVNGIALGASCRRLTAAIQRGLLKMCPPKDGQPWKKSSRHFCSCSADLNSSLVKSSTLTEAGIWFDTHSLSQRVRNA